MQNDPELNDEQKREEIFAQYIIDNRATVRKVAGIFNASKSAVLPGCNNTENFCIEAAKGAPFRGFVQFKIFM